MLTYKNSTLSEVHRVRGEDVLQVQGRRLGIIREEKWIRTTFLSLYFADTLLQVDYSPLACSQISVC